MLLLVEVEVADPGDVEFRRVVGSGSGAGSLEPGVIGDLGRALSDAGVNIATFHLGRAEPSGDAIALLQIDQPLDPEGLKAVRGLPNVIQVKPLAF